MGYEKLKSTLSLCDGARKGSGAPCRGTLYRCRQCGGVGCRQSREELCSNQAFDAVDRCLKCGASGQMETLPPGDYRPQQAWLHPPVPGAD